MFYSPGILIINKKVNLKTKPNFGERLDKMPIKNTNNPVIQNNLDVPVVTPDTLRNGIVIKRAAKGNHTLNYMQRKRVMGVSAY